MQSSGYEVVLEEERTDGHIIRLINCFAAVNNRWSTYSDLSREYTKIRGTVSHVPPKENIKSAMRRWHQLRRSAERGFTHSEGALCHQVEPHAICSTQMGNELAFQIHPTLGNILLGSILSGNPTGLAAATSAAAPVAVAMERKRKRQCDGECTAEAKRIRSWGADFMTRIVNNVSSKCESLKSDIFRHVEAIKIKTDKNLSDMINLARRVSRTEEAKVAMEDRMEAIEIGFKPLLTMEERVVTIGNRLERLETIEKPFEARLIQAEAVETALSHRLTDAEATIRDMSVQICALKKQATVQSPSPCPDASKPYTDIIRDLYGIRGALQGACIQGGVNSGSLLTPLLSRRGFLIGPNKHIRKQRVTQILREHVSEFESALAVQCPAILFRGRVYTPTREGVQL